MARFKGLKWFSFCVVVYITLMLNTPSAFAKDSKGSSSSDKEELNYCHLLKYGAYVGGAAAGLAAAPALLAGAGFGAGGIAAGSLAAKLYGLAAAANGGAVASGSVLASLQSAGAAGLGLTSKAILGAGSGYLASSLFGCDDPETDLQTSHDEAENDGANSKKAHNHKSPYGKVHSDGAHPNGFDIDNFTTLLELMQASQRSGRNGNEKSGAGSKSFQGATEERARQGSSILEHIKPADLEPLCSLWNILKNEFPTESSEAAEINQICTLLSLLKGIQQQPKM